MPNIVASATAKCGCRVHATNQDLGGCAGWRCEAFERSASQGMCDDCKRELRNADSLRNLGSLAFRMAWETARRAVSQFGGSAVAFFRSALQDVYAFIRSTVESRKAQVIRVVEVLRRSERAFLLDVEFGGRRVEAWWPKSQVRLRDGVLQAPAWLVREKLAA